MLSLVLVAAAFATAGIGALGGLGGAVLLVPALAVAGMPAAEAAPLGLVSVAAGSIAAGGLQLRERTVNHRLGVTTEAAATLGATTGALGSGIVSERVLTWGLATVAVLAAAAMLRTRGRRGPGATVQDQTVGEWPGQIAGVAPPEDEPVPYRAARLPVALALMWVSGVIAGVAGASGGFLKTPVTTDVMRIPLKVAASTTTFTIGVTAAAGLVVFVLQGRVDPQAAAAVIAGSLLGGQVGAALQSRAPVAVIRTGLGVLLVGVAVVLVVTG
ncbi:sulfite exporter TauE/SafE family protein [Euzebya sp.]|uniref:sulfite exporter TauE/SafE family protein n=1 Tax=Euzebya sp. TaxID=1971409 RepID=UPI0035194B1B